MNPISKIIVASRLFRHRFGHVKGLRLWIELLKEKLLSPSTVFQVNVPGIRHPVFLRAHTSDVEVFCQIFGHAELDHDVNFPVSYIVDAGANIGLSSVFLVHKYPGVAIDAIEISSSNIEILQMNVSFYPKINIVPKGLWWKSSFLRIANPSAEPWAFFVEETTVDDKQGIPAIGIPELIAQRQAKQIDILKIDIEGGELQVFGSPDTMWMSQVRCLMIELHDHFKPGCREAVISALRPYKYTHEQRGEYNIFTLGNIESN